MNRSKRRLDDVFPVVLVMATVVLSFGLEVTVLSGAGFGRNGGQAAVVAKAASEQTASASSAQLARAGGASSRPRLGAAPFSAPL